ncbi:MAG TPA: nucleoside-diphosphate kinase [Candidatus Woesearchaeota archaeon]|nr:MAG: nucleoside-diphosphate kinase [Candidatus Woesearchaeota archaeon]HDD70600.1 nucleoside-diphosphate kinase [Candidatus Woesearchaeota archaeon]
MKERTLVLLKPDAVQRGLIGEIITRFEKAGFKIIGMKLVWADEKTAGKHYADDENWLKSVGEKAKKSYEKKGKSTEMTELEIGQKIRSQLMDFISMSPSVALCIEGHGAIEKVRTLVGATAPMNAAPGTIRGDLSFDSYDLADVSGRPIQNLIHASDSKESAEREIKIWFKDEEIHAFERIDEPLLYRKVE